MISVIKYEAKGHSLGVDRDEHARSRYIQQDDVAFYRITSISCYKLHVASAGITEYRARFRITQTS